MARDISKAVEIIKSFEGILDGDPSTVNLDPYLCPANYWTIGWGHVVLDDRGKQIRGKSRKEDAYAMYPEGLSMQDAHCLLMDDVRRFSYGVEKRVKVPINNNQFCALVSFSFNVGLGAFQKSTLLRLINQGDADKADSQFARWNKAGGRVLNGLIRRRKAETKLWQLV